MHITIDGIKVIFSDKDKNIIEVADKAGIGIPAPCYRSKTKNNCCNSCVIEIDGKQVYACGTKPEEGMEITVNRDDLIAIRKERIKNYKDSADQGCGCNCSCNSSPDNRQSCC
jgi:NADH-quinone oxidoreductase subunit G